MSDQSESILPMLLIAFPAFEVRWERHLKYWDSEPAGSYNDMSEFVLFVVEDLYEQGDYAETQRVFDVLESIFPTLDEPAKALITLGVLD